MKVSVRMKEGYGLDNDKWTSKLQGGGLYTTDNYLLIHNNIFNLGQLMILL